MPRPKAYMVEGKKVVGVTTPIGAFDAGGKTNNLLDWAQKLAVNYVIIDGKLVHSPIYWRKARDGRGDIGTLTHAMFLRWLDPKQPEPEIEGFDQKEIDEAEAMSNSLKGWIHKHPISPLAIEEPFVSAVHRYGGTPDIIDYNDVIDVKTGFVNEFSCMLQLSAYANLAIENGLTDKQLGGIILQPYEGKVRTYHFSPRTLATYFPTFLALLQAYNDEKKFNYSRRKRK